VFLNKGWTTDNVENGGSYTVITNLLIPLPFFQSLVYSRAVNFIEEDYENGTLETNAENMTKSVRLEVFAAVAMKNGVFWDVTPCGSYKNRRFGGT
jgi:hypothetical protein